MPSPNRPTFDASVSMTTGSRAGIQTPHRRMYRLTGPGGAGGISGPARADLPGQPMTWSPPQVMTRAYQGPLTNEVRFLETLAWQAEGRRTGPFDFVRLEVSTA